MKTSHFSKADSEADKSLIICDTPPQDFVNFDYSQLQYVVQSVMSALDADEKQASENYTEDDLKDASRCTKCKGECCKQMGCHYSPEDFSDISFDALKNLIDEGKISIDWFDRSEKPTRGYYLRARHIGGDIVDPSFGGRCINLTDTGCSLDWEHRPKGGRYLQAGKSDYTSCINRYSKEQCSTDWLPYYRILSKLVEHYGDTDDPTYIDYLRHSSSF